MSRLTRDGTAEPVSRDQIRRRKWGQDNIYFPCSADHEKGSQPYPVHPYSAIILRPYIHICERSELLICQVHQFGLGCIKNCAH